MSEKKRIVVTGIGSMACTGIGVDANWENLINGRSGIDKITYFDTKGYHAHVGGEIRNLDPMQFGFSQREVARYDRSVLIGVSAAEEAISDSGLDFNNRGENIDIGVIVGTGIGGVSKISTASMVTVLEGPGRVSPFLVPSGTPEVAAHTVALKHGIHGATFGVNTACASGNDAMIIAIRRLQYGNENIIIAGGTEAAVCEIAYASFGNMKALSRWDGDGDPKRVSRPFEKNRSGFVMAEGAGILIFETLEHAKARGAKIYAEVAGCGQTTDAYHMTAPEPSGKYVALAMKMALKEGGLEPEEVGYINAHGTSTKYNDRTETKAIKTAFGDHAYKLCVSSTKSMTGHMVGGCGGVEAMVCLKAIETGIIPPTINYEVPDPECDLDYVPNIAREKKVDVVASNNLGFGGHNSVLIFKKFE